MGNGGRKTEDSAKDDELICGVTLYDKQRCVDRRKRLTANNPEKEKMIVDWACGKKERR